MDSVLLDSVPLLDSVEGDRQGLVALFNQCNGRNWYNNWNWLTDKPFEEWYGVIVNSSGRLISLCLNCDNLSGSLPKEIGNWTQVQEVYFKNNNLSGSLPREIGNWIQFFYLQCNNNLFTGLYPHQRCPYNSSGNSMGHRSFYTCLIRHWVRRERRRFLFSLV